MTISLSFLLLQDPPVVTPYFVNGTVDVVEKTWPSLVCNVDSNPASTVQWYFSTDGGSTFQTVYILSQLLLEQLYLNSDFIFILDLIYVTPSPL